MGGDRGFGTPRHTCDDHQLDSRAGYGRADFPSTQEFGGRVMEQVAKAGVFPGHAAGRLSITNVSTHLRWKRSSTNLQVGFAIFSTGRSFGIPRALFSRSNYALQRSHSRVTPLAEEAQASRHAARR